MDLRKVLNTCELHKLEASMPTLDVDVTEICCLGAIDSGLDHQKPCLDLGGARGRGCDFGCLWLISLRGCHTFRHNIGPARMTASIAETARMI